MSLNYFYDNIISTLECIKITHEMFDFARRGLCEVNPDIFSTNTLGYRNLPRTLELVPQLTTRISQDYGHLGQIKFSNTYTRIYRHDNFLAVHRDKPGLDITLSVCVYSDIDSDWPMYVTDTPWDSNWQKMRLIEPPDTVPREAYVTRPKQGVCVLGTKSPHWRNRLACAPDQSVVQVFWHWSLLTETDQ